MKELSFYQELVRTAWTRAEKWRKEAKEIWRAYVSERRFNVLYSNTDLLLSALSTNNPRPVIRVRFGKEQTTQPQLRNLARTAAEVAERAVVYNADQFDLKNVLEAASREALLSGRGVLRASYEVQILSTPTEPAWEQLGIQAPVQERIGAQKVELKNVPYDEFLCTDAKDWSGVWWVAFRHLMDKTELKEKFGDEAAEQVPLSYREDADPQDKKHVRELAEVWELWDKREKTVLFFTTEYGKELSREEDPYGLEGFFPCGRPLQFVRGRDLTPVPEYRLYRKTANELSEVVKRIDALVKNIRAKALYSADFKDELADLKNADDNTDVPVNTSFNMLSQSGGIAGIIAEYPNAGKSQVLGVLEQRKQSALAEIYEITGIADIMRGTSDARETATAQEIKGQFGSVRLKARQSALQYFIRDSFKICAELVCEHFTAENLQAICGVDLPTAQQKEQARLAVAGAQAQGAPVPPQLAELLQKPSWPELLDTLRTDRLRNCTLDTESTATAFDQTQQDKTARLELFETTHRLLGAALPLMQANPEFIDALKAHVLFAVDAFEQSRVVKEAYETAFAAWEARIKAPQQPAGPTPEQMIAQAEQTKAQADLISAQARAAEAQAKMAQAAQEVDLDKAQLLQNALKDNQELELKRQKTALDAWKEGRV